MIGLLYLLVYIYILYKKVVNQYGYGVVTLYIILIH